MAGRENWHVVLETERLVLRRFVPEDAELLAALDADPEVRRYVSSGPPPTVDFYRDEKLPDWIAYYAQGPFGYWAAHLRASGEFVGWFHLRPDRYERTTPATQELGYRLARHAWGQGLATEGSRALLDLARDTLGVRRVSAHCLEANRGSSRVMEKCGLRFSHRFVVPEHLLPGTTEEQRRAVGYVVEWGGRDADGGGGGTPQGARGELR